jgi:hypothetical protein
MVDSNEHELFKRNYNLYSVDAYIPLSWYDLCVAINSCKLFIGNLSSPLSAAYAMHKKTVVGLCSGEDGTHHMGLQEIIPNLTSIPDKNETTEEIKRLCS